MSERVEIREKRQVEIHADGSKVERTSNLPGRVQTREKRQVETRDERVAVERASSGLVGPPGPTGLTGTLNRQQPTGATDGVNLLFAASSPFVADSTVLYLNGLAQSVPDDYSEISTTEIAMVEAPQPGDRFLITYMEA